ncbi:MAG: glycosyltransferase family 2 protein [Bacilli bacterium]|nr:glycosyltransferase family 2 protein [Bacilli bacterium]
MLGSIIDFIGESYLCAKNIYNIIGTVLSIMLAYKAIYWAIGFLFTRKFKPAKNYHKYGILIAARNEEAVIGNLLDSINKQDYPKEHLTVFVVADNCTDDTAGVARKYGAKVYERQDPTRRTKGFALQFLFENIKRDYGIESFEGYFIFDADNLLNKNYITKMNDAFDSGEKIITSYRNTKNFDENWIASTYALHWIRSIRSNHRARSVLHLATNIQGTGFLFANEIVKNGWNYTGLTEDRALTADAVARGYQITYQDEAEFFDEQPISLKVALRQRLRWSKGHLLAFLETGPKLFVNIFFGKFFIKDKWGIEDKKRGFFSGLLESIRHRFASYDTLMQLTPLVVFNFARWLLVSVLIYACFSYGNGVTAYLFGGSSIFAKFLSFIFNKPIITINSGISAFFLSMLLAIWLRLLYRMGAYIKNMWVAIYVFIVERHRIKKIPFLKKVLFTLTWPTFDIIGRYTTYFAIFKKVEWKPIPHTSKVTIDEVDTSNGVK